MVMNLEPCDVIFVKRKLQSSIFDIVCQRLICWATRSPYFHVAYYVDETSAFEANTFRTAGRAALSDYLEYDVKRLLLPAETRSRILARIMATGGSAYGWGEVIALALRLKFGINVFYDDPAKYICSEEIVDAVYAEIGVHLVEQPTGDVSPADLWRSPFLTQIT
jgi:hypothetical protein